MPAPTPLPTIALTHRSKGINMPYTIEQLNDLPYPTVLATMTEPFDSAGDTLRSVNDCNTVLAQTEGDPVYFIINLSQLNLNLSNLMQGLASAFLPHSDVKTDHLFSSRVKSIMIGSGPLMKLAVSSAGQNQYGSRQMELFETLDEALDHIRHAETA